MLARGAVLDRLVVLPRASWVRRLLHAAAVTLLVVLTSLGLVVSSAGGAQAFVPVPIIPVLTASIGTASEGAVGAGVAAVCATGVGCAILAVGAVAIVGYSLYSSRDTWVPWVQGGWAAVSGADTAPANDTYALDGTIVISPDGHGWSLRVTRVAPFLTNEAVTYNGRWDTLCSLPDGTVYMAQSGSAASLVVPIDGTPLMVQGSTCNGWGITRAVRVSRYDGAYNYLGSYPTFGDPTANVEAAQSYRTTVQCVNETTGVQVALENTYSGGLGEGGKGGISVPSCAAAGLGHGASIITESKLPGQSTWQKVWGTNPVNEAAYPACNPGAITVCVLAVVVDGVTCVTGGPGCAAWSTLKQTEPSRVSCHWGPYTVPIARCNVLERVYTTEGAPMTAPNTDGNPLTLTQPEPLPTPTGTPSVTPTAGAPGYYDPTKVPVTVPNVSPNGDTIEENNCYPSGGAAWNPVEWVMRPVKCALSWAFIPKADEWTTRYDGFKAKMGSSSMGRWWSGFGAWGAAFGVTGAGSGCQGPGVGTGFMGEKGYLARTIYPFDACSGPKATAAATARLLLTVGIGWGTGWRLVRIVGRPFGYDLDLMDKTTHPENY